MPDVDRRPIYKVIAAHYKDQILSEELKPGDMLPSVPQLMEQWHVGRGTASKVLSELHTAKVAWSSPRGTFVVGNDELTLSPRERARPLRRPNAAEVITVISAAAVQPAPNVAEILDLAPGDLVIRREEVTSRHGKPVQLAVDWVPSVGGQITCAHLLDPEPVDGGVLGCLERATGRDGGHGHDAPEARRADAREAGHLAVAIGSPVLALVTTFGDAEGTLLYQERVIPEGIKIEYEYDLDRGE